MIVEDGRRYRLEIALDDSLHEQKSVALNRYENLETRQMKDCGWR